MRIPFRLLIGAATVMAVGCFFEAWNELAAENESVLRISMGPTTRPRTPSFRVPAAGSSGVETIKNAVQLEPTSLPRTPAPRSSGQSSSLASIGG